MYSLIGVPNIIGVDTQVNYKGRKDTYGSSVTGVDVNLNETLSKTPAADSL